MNSEPTRRQFLATAGAALTAASSAAASVPIVDTHVHLWDRTRFRLAWLAGNPTLDRDFHWDDYRRASDGLNIIKGVYMEVDVDPHEHEREARTVIDLCRRGGTVLAGAVISGRPASDGFGAYIRPLAREREVKGLRQVLHGPGTPQGFCLDPAFVDGVRLLGELGLSFDLCMPPGELADGAKLAGQCPDTQLILDHCGNADVFSRDLGPWKKGLDAVASKPNVCAKVSGIIASTKGRPWKPEDLAPIVNHVLDAFGPDRVVFGGDWPVCTLGGALADWVGALRHIVAGRNETDRRKLFHDNAVRVYRLS